MIYPSLSEFREKAKQGNLIPVYKEILADIETPVSAFRKLINQEYAFLLESVEGGEKIARYSFLGSSPSLIFKSKGNEIQIIRNGTVVEQKQVNDPLESLKQLLRKYQSVSDQNLPRFYGGAVGYLSYDMVRFMEVLPDKNPDELQMPDAYFMFTDTILIFDHVQHKIKVVSNAHIENSDIDTAYYTAVDQVQQLIEVLREPALSIHKDDKKAENHLPAEVLTKTGEITSNYQKAEFESDVEKSKEYIRAGDIFQVVLAQRLETKISADPFNIYRALRSINPSPYMYYLQFGDIKIAGSSPEVMVRVEDRVVEVRPIAGTRRRGKSDAEDDALIEDLLADPKERAEHIMLVDLGRNDVGRVSKYGTVAVTELMAIEKYSHVMHIVSNVRGELKDDMDEFDALRACFPAGTVSGAPKIRAMEIIDELEPTRRGTYAGAVGYFSFSGNLDTCITIRTILIKGNTAYISVGAGLVADSVPANEFLETMNKAKAMLRAIELAEEGLE
ncbi:MAG: anthranilate synthase component I [bacterium]|nr:anthranilate synthase component I [bacterium]